MPPLIAKLLRLAWPVMLSRLGVMAMGVCDVVVVGQFAPAQLSHQALGLAPTSMLLVSGIGMLTGVQVLTANVLGASEPRAAGAVWRKGLAISLIAGVIAIACLWTTSEWLFLRFGIAPELAKHATAVARVLALSIPMYLCYISSAFFLEAIRRPVAPSVAIWIANLMNLALNLWLVPRHGAVGSAFATFGARSFLALWSIVWVLRLPDAEHFGVRARTTSQGPGFRELLHVGAAAALSQAAEAGAFSSLTIIAGRSGERAVAAYQIILNLLAVLFMVSLGVSTATTVLTSDAIGRSAPREAAHASWTGLLLNTCFMLGFAGVLVLFSRQLAAGYSADAALATFVASLMPLAAAALAPDGGQAVVASALRAQRDNWYPTASHLLSYVLVMPGLALLLAEYRRLGVAGLLLAIVIASVVSVGLLTARLWVLSPRLPQP